MFQLSLTMQPRLPRRGNYSPGYDTCIIRHSLVPQNMTNAPPGHGKRICGHVKRIYGHNTSLPGQMYYIAW
jgi:hypothetical protein